MRVGTRVRSNLTTIQYVITAIVADCVELKLDKDCANGIIVTDDELKARYTEVVDPFEANFLR